MTFTQAQAESLFAQVSDLQSALVRRGELASTDVHEIVEADERPQYGSVWVRCACGAWFSFRNDNHDEARAMGAYTLHMADSLGLRVRLGRAA